MYDAKVSSCPKNIQCSCFWSNLFLNVAFFTYCVGNESLGIPKHLKKITEIMKFQIKNEYDFQQTVKCGYCGIVAHILQSQPKERDENC